jgi:hypothetical protein
VDRLRLSFLKKKKQRKENKKKTKQNKNESTVRGYID